ncbi:MAG: hypothetical protein GKR89_03680 [Candidatus Latescibacteria bacterium]|nr:hypothetical protein [Candidatus Latescibacterota bacterium]
MSPDSVRVVARHIAAHPEGVPNDKSNDYLSFLADQCDNFQEHCAQAGDATILHPFLLHGQSRNPSGRARFIFNLQAVMSTDFDLESGSSAVEQAIMRAISDI